MKILENLTEKTLCTVPDYSSKVTITSGTTLTYDVYAMFSAVSVSNNGAASYNSFKINGTDVSVKGFGNQMIGMVSAGVSTTSFFGFIASGSKVEWDTGSPVFFRV